MKFILLFLALTTITYASESNVYDFSWLDPDKEVYVLQNRKFRKSGKLYVGGTYGNTISGAFIDSSDFNFHAGYFFHEDWGLEVSYSKASGKTNKTHDGVNEQAGAVAFYRKIDSSQSAMLMWSPFYSKINTFNKIFYYDWLFGAGFASITTLDNREEFNNDDSTLTSESNTTFSWMTGFRFYITDSWSFRMDVRAIHLNAEMVIDDDDSEKQWSHYYNFNLGMNFTF